MKNDLLIYASQKGAPEQFVCKKRSFSPKDVDPSMRLLQVYTDIREQTFHGFGGAFTQAAADTFFAMDGQNQTRVLNLLFGAEGLGYTCGRVAIGACDFSCGNYAYSSSEQAFPEDFSVACDEQGILPFLRLAKKRCPHLRLLASPWSPPAWMKTTKDMCHGGSLRPECYDAYANYLVLFLQAYARAGVPIEYLTVQNEPEAVQTWESCLYTAEQEQRFIRDHLVPALHRSGVTCKLLIWDHNKEKAFIRAREIFSDPSVRNAVAGIAFHWYSGDHFENIGLCRRWYPEKELVFTEGCVELTAANTVMAMRATQGENAPTALCSGWRYGECYGHDIIGNLNAGMNWSLDWNLLLDEQGGPNHVGNYCSAPLIYDKVLGQLTVQPSYIFIAHLSRFIRPGAQRLACSRYTDALEMTSFLGPDGRVVVVVMNSGETSVPFTLCDVFSGRLCPLEIPAHAIWTIVYEA